LTPQICGFTLELFPLQLGYDLVSPRVGNRDPDPNRSEGFQQAVSLLNAEIVRTAVEAQGGSQREFWGSTNSINF
jgi:hypothetical protein